MVQPAALNWNSAAFCKGLIQDFGGSCLASPEAVLEKEGKDVRGENIGEGKEEAKTSYPPSYCPTDVVTKSTQDGAQGPKNEIKATL